MLLQTLFALALNFIKNLGNRRSIVFGCSALLISCATISSANNHIQVEEVTITRENCWAITVIHPNTKIVISKHAKASVNSISFISAGWKDTPDNLKDLFDPKFYHGFCLITADTARGALEFNLDGIFRARGNGKEVYIGYADSIW